MLQIDGSSFLSHVDHKVKINKHAVRNSDTPASHSGCMIAKSKFYKKNFGILIAFRVAIRCF